MLSNNSSSENKEFLNKLLHETTEILNQLPESELNKLYTIQTALSMNKIPIDEPITIYLEHSFIQDFSLGCLLSHIFNWSIEQFSTEEITNIHKVLTNIVQKLNKDPTKSHAIYFHPEDLLQLLHTHIPSKELRDKLTKYLFSPPAYDEKHLTQITCFAPYTTGLKLLHNYIHSTIVPTWIFDLKNTSNLSEKDIEINYIEVVINTYPNLLSDDCQTTLIREFLSKNLQIPIKNIKIIHSKFSDLWEDKSTFSKFHSYFIWYSLTFLQSQAFHQIVKSLTNVTSNLLNAKYFFFSKSLEHDYRIYQMYKEDREELTRQYSQIEHYLQIFTNMVFVDNIPILYNLKIFKEGEKHE